MAPNRWTGIIPCKLGFTQSGKLVGLTLPFPSSGVPFSSPHKREHVYALTLTSKKKVSPLVIGSADVNVESM